MDNWRRSFYALWIAQWIAIIGYSAVMPFIPLFVHELGLTDLPTIELWSGIVLGGTGATMAVASPVWGVLADRYGRKMMVQRSMYGGAVVLVLMALSRSVWDLLVLRGAQGALSGTVPASAALAAVVSPRRLLARNLGLMQTAVFAGSSAGPLVGGLLADRIGYRWLFLITGLMLLAAGLTVTRFVDEPAMSGTAGAALNPRSFARDLWSAARAPSIAAMNLVILGTQMSSSLVLPVIPLLVKQISGDGADVATQSGLVFGAAAVTSALAAMFAGRYGNRWGYRRVVVGCSVAAGVSAIPLAFARDVPLLAALFALQGLFLGALMPTVYAIISYLTPPERRGTAFGLSSTSMCVAMMIGPLAGGVLAATIGLPEVFLFSGLILVGMAFTVARRTPSIASA